MKKYLLIFITPLFLFAQTDKTKPAAANPNTIDTLQEALAQPSSPIINVADTDQTPAPAKPTPKKSPATIISAADNTSKLEGSRSVMLIDPKQRAADLLAAYNMLKKNRSLSKLYFQLTNGNKISNIMNMQISDNGTLIIFQMTSNTGMKNLVVFVEDIDSISTY